MSNPESFIDEVTEEVRRDRLYGLMRRWGWIPALLVLGIVGGASWSEWQKAQHAARAQAFGDALLSALGAEDLPARRNAIDNVVADGPDQAAILSLLSAAALASGDGADTAAAQARLLSLAETPELDPSYRHLALFKVILMGGTGDAARDAAMLEELATPGAPYRPLAVEQQALSAIRAGDPATAITLLRVLTQEAGVTEGLRRRATQLIVALGGTPEPV